MHLLLPLVELLLVKLHLRGPLFVRSLCEHRGACTMLVPIVFLGDASQTGRASLHYPQGLCRSLGAWAGVRRKRCLRMCMCQSFDRRGRGPWKKPCNCGSTSVTSAFLGLHLGGLNLVRRVQVRKFIVLPSFRILRIPVQKCIVVLCNRERLKTAKPISRRTGNTAVAIRSRA